MRGLQQPATEAQRLDEDATGVPRGERAADRTQASPSAASARRKAARRRPGTRLPVPRYPSGPRPRKRPTAPASEEPRRGPPEAGSRGRRAGLDRPRSPAPVSRDPAEASTRPGLIAPRRHDPARHGRAEASSRCGAPSSRVLQGVARGRTSMPDLPWAHGTLTPHSSRVHHVGTARVGVVGVRRADRRRDRPLRLRRGRIGRRTPSGRPRTREAARRGGACRRGPRTARPDARSPRGCFRVPRAPELLGEAGLGDSRVVVVDFLPGYRVDAAHLPPGRGAATSLGGALAALHALPASGRPCRRGSPPARRRRCAPT